jgi:hypothetical protein
MTRISSSPVKGVDDCLKAFHMDGSATFVEKWWEREAVHVDLSGGARNW